jgi:hypothetical protein
MILKNVNKIMVIRGVDIWISGLFERPNALPAAC